MRSAAQTTGYPSIGKVDTIWLRQPTVNHLGSPSRPAAIVRAAWQQIMRFNELLGLMRGKLADGERAYDSLFAGFRPDEIATTKPKDLQWKLAEQMDSLTPLKQAVSKPRFDARELEKALVELYDIIAMTPEAID